MSLFIKQKKKIITETGFLSPKQYKNEVSLSHNYYS